MSGLGLGLGLIRRRRTSAAATLWDYDLTTGSLPPVLSVSRATSGSRIASSGLIEVLGANAARFDYDPVSHAGLGLLVEPQETYYGPTSDDPGNTSAGWGLGGNLAYSTASAASPLSATDTVSVCGAGGFAYSAVQGASVVPIGTELTQCWIVRNSSATQSRVVYRDGSIPAQVNLVINWASAAAGAAISSIAPSSPLGGVTITASGFSSMGGGWYLVWCAFTVPTTTNANFIRLDPAVTPVGAYVNIAAAWVVTKARAYAPSYAQTTSGSVTRDADVPVISDVSRNYRITYAPLNGSATQTQDVAVGQQPPALPGRWTRIQQL